MKKLDSNVNYLHFDFFTAFCSGFPVQRGFRSRRFPPVPKVYFWHWGLRPLPPPSHSSRMTDDPADEALRRFRLIRPFLEDDVPLPAIVRTSGVPLRTLRRWTEHYRRRGLAGLKRRARRAL